MVTPIYQLNTPHCTKPVEPGKSCGSGDCVVCQIVMGIDYSTGGHVVVNQAQIRALPTIPDHGGLSLVNVRQAIKGLEDKFTSRGFAVPTVTVHDNNKWEALITAIQNKRLWTIIFWNNMEWASICKDNDVPGLAGDLEFKGDHAVAARMLRFSTARRPHALVRIWNSLWDGRRDQPSGTRVVLGPQDVPLGWFKKAAIARTGTNNLVDFVTIDKAKLLQKPEPDPDPCARATVPMSFDEGHASEGVI